MEKREKNDRIEAWNRAVLCFGTARIFEEREKCIILFNKFTKITELIVPLITGSAAITFGINFSLMPKYVLIATGGIAIMQLIFSLWALIFSFEDKLKHYSDSVSNNTSYSEKFEEIGRRYDEDINEYEKTFEKMILLDNRQREIDGRMGITNKEKRFGMSEALSRFNRYCSMCGKKPDIDNSKKCKNCGN